MPWHDYMDEDEMERMQMEMLGLDSQKESLVLLKPDCLERNLTGEVIRILCNDGFMVHEIHTLKITPEFCKKHYEEHVGKEWYPGLENAMCGKPLVAIRLGGNPYRIRDTCQKIRSIYVDTQYVGPRNIVHSSADPQAAAREVDLWFKSV